MNWKMLNNGICLKSLMDGQGAWAACGEPGPAHGEDGGNCTAQSLSVLPPSVQGCVVQSPELTLATPQ